MERSFAQPFQPKAKSSQTEKEAEESLIPEGFEFLADKVKVEGRLKKDFMIQ